MEKISKELCDAVLERVMDIRINGFKEKSPNVPKTLPVGPVIGEEKTVPTSEGDILIYYHNPRKLKKMPVYFNFHGGGMAAGEAQQDEFFCGWLAEDMDICVINVEYPLAPEHPFPHGVNASYETVKYVLANAEEFDVDPSKVLFGGFSAGGCMALDMMLLGNRKKEFSYLGVVAIYPGIDYGTPGITAGDTSLEKTSDVYGYAYLADGGDFKDPLVSPLYASAEDLKGTPSVFIMPGEIDPLRDHSERMAKALMQANVPIIYHQMPNCAHGFTHRAYVEEPRQALRETEAYIKYLIEK